LVTLGVLFAHVFGHHFLDAGDYHVIFLWDDYIFTVEIELFTDIKALEQSLIQRGELFLFRVLTQNAMHMTDCKYFHHRIILIP
jgi:hypothetical protein